MHSARLVAASVFILAAFAAWVAPARSAAPYPADTMLLDFQADWCGPCRQMESTVAQLIAAGYPIRTVNIDREPELRRQYGVTGIPCFVLVSGGRELARTEGRVSAGELQAMFAKAATAAMAAAPSRPAPPVAAISAPAPDPFFSAGSSRRLNDPSANGDPSPRGQSLGAQSPAAPSQGWGSVPAPASSGSAPIGPLPTSQFLAASVRISVEDPTGVSHGSGTLIDARNGEALVLTCAHIFRDSQGKGTVLVDVFGAQPQPKLPGRVVSYDLKRDVALVSVRPAGPVVTVPVAPPGHATRVGDRVASVGCDGGADPTVRESRVSALNKFLGPPNVEVAGQPVEGRSGGGLFSADGCVIGVCNAADPADNEGLYAAVATIHAQLDQANLAAIYRRSPGAPATASGGLARANDALGGGASAALNMPSQTMPARMPSSPLVAVTGAGPKGSTAPGAAGSLTPQERAILAELQQKSQHAEVICIVRSLSDPQAKSEIIVLDRASPAFLRQLSAERGAQDGRRLTSSFDAAPPASGSPAANTPIQGQTQPCSANPSLAGPGAPRLWEPNWRVPK
jgi:S1-C subfamily serine protease